MKFLIDFITNDNSKISSLIKCCDDENKILRHLAKCYIDGNPQISVFDLLNTVFGTDEYKFLGHLKDIKALRESGWISQGFSMFKNQSNIDTNLALLHTEISLSAVFLKLLENGNLGFEMPEISAYNDHLEYLKDQFLRIDLYQKLSNFSQSVANEAKSAIEQNIKKLEDIIQKRLSLSKISINVEQIFKENGLSEKEQIIFLALLKEEYVGELDANRDTNNILGIISRDEFERIKNKTLLDNGSKLIENELIDYDETLSNFGGFSRTFYITDEILQSIMHPKNDKKSTKIALETLVKEQEIFELIEPTTNIEDVVLNEKTKELLEIILKQVDKKVLSRLSSWGIKTRKNVDAKIIFYGPAGTGKTMSALSLAKSLKKSVLSFDCSKILSKYVGESEQNVRKIFDTYKEICDKSKSEPVLLLNEADQFLSTRIESGNGVDKMLNQMQNIFLEQIERFNGVMIATTNFLQSFDVAFARRFDYKIEFKKPDFAARLMIWRKVLPESASFEEKFDIKRLAEFELSGAQIILVLKNTALKVAVRDDGIFTMSDFESEIKREMASNFGEDKKVGF